MAKRTVKPELIKSLRDWSARWPKVGNLGFDTETREPAVFAPDSNQQVAKIAWRREGDILTILASAPQQPPTIVAAATKQLKQQRDAAASVVVSSTEQLRTAEATLLAAWREYHAADAATRATLRRNIITAENELANVQRLTAEQLQRGRAVRIVDEIKLPGIKGRFPQYGTYVPTVSLDKRGIVV